MFGVRWWLRSGRASHLRTAVATLILLSLSGEIPCQSAEAAAGSNPQPERVPGVIIEHSPASTAAYIGSPSIAVLANGDYLASHDFFGPGTSNDRTVVFRSHDRGQNWNKLVEIGQWWSTLFVHRGDAYLLGTSKENGYVVIRRSRDGGFKWTTPLGPDSGLLRDDGQYHGAPTPVIEHGGRLWRGIEHRDPPAGWGVSFQAGVLSAPIDSDLLERSNWTFSNFVPSDTNWLGGGFGGWLEGNAVVMRNGKILDILRVDIPFGPEKAALINISDDGRLASFDARTGFIDFPGGAKKFSIRFDPKSDLYWSLTSVDRSGSSTNGPAKRPAAVRNTLALICSKDLRHWIVRDLLLQHRDVVSHAFQYVDWLFDGDDVIAVCRTAYDDGQGGAHNYHDANYLTFHRFSHFRDRNL